MVIMHPGKLLNSLKLRHLAIAVERNDEHGYELSFLFFIDIQDEEVGKSGREEGKAQSPIVLTRRAHHRLYQEEHS